ncbi:RING finger protein 214 isoform X2 [Bufo bufo]|uniref:RING finger protein 214 isoform X2 n=1 Tax=Bufo bufo TaxID=8384 RepID=UPI001ABE0EF9|nr:RING finger protein 214 isoform X2 [Bufo bufo]XP_040281834.1 RING finger protein 214 isoform X2 [Bufo bufo]XP_040281842.1 RING finger protein 214 isoform X2 [Bufo bufo]
MISSTGDMPSAESDLTGGNMAEGGAVCQVNIEGDHCSMQSALHDPGDPGGLATKCIAVQTESEKQDAETITEEETEKFLKLLVDCRELMKDNYQEVLDRHIQAEKQLQVQIRQLRQQNEEERQRHKGYLKKIQDLTTKKEETRKKTEKERRDQSQKDRDLGGESIKLQSKNESLQKEHNEIERKITDLLAEQAAERKECDAELTVLRNKDSQMNQHILEEMEHVTRAEVRSLESRRDLLLISLEEAEKEAEVTLSYLRVAPPNLEWRQLKQRWDARLAGIQQMKTNLQEQFETQIKQVKNGTKLSSLPLIMAPNLTPPPSDPTVMLHRIALAPAQVMPTTDIGIQGNPSLPYQRSHPVTFPPPSFPGNVASGPSLPTASHNPGTAEASGPPGTDKLSKILEKLQARFPQCNKGHLTEILQQIKKKRGALSGLTVEALCHLVEAHIEQLQLKESTNPIAKSVGHGRPQYPVAQINPVFLPSTYGGYSGRPQVCLMCQKIVQPHDRQPVSCHHAIHRECAKSWPSTNHDCPFCPSLR